MEPGWRVDLELDDLGEVLGRQRVEDDDLVEPIEELGLERPTHDPEDRLLARLRRQQRVHEELRTEVRRHHEDDVAEVDRPALSVGQATVVEDLQQDVERLGPSRPRRAGSRSSRRRTVGELAASSYPT